MATSLRKVVRKFDAVAQIGGDEFILLLDMIDIEERLILTTNRILDAVSSVKHDGTVVPCSLGATFIKSHDTYDMVLQRADAAMY